MAERSHGVKISPFAAENRSTGARIDGQVFTGLGRDVVLAISEQTGQSTVAVLDAIVHRLLVQKGADWTGVILSEYMGVYGDSVGIFSLVWDDLSEQLVAHGSAFQSAANPWAALLAHIRTLDEFKGLGLGTLVTEQVTAEAFDRFSSVVVLETDDKLNRLAAGGRAAHSLYSRLGYAVLGEKRLADTVDWMMVVDPVVFDRCQRAKVGGQLPGSLPPEINQAREHLVAATRLRFGQLEGEIAIEPASAGDLANLFVLLNLCPRDDFQLKLTSWDVQHGPELERAFIATLRQGIVDEDRLQDASMVVRDEEGRTVAICAARQFAPFTRQTYAIDFYCLPELLSSHRSVVLELVEQTLKRIETAEGRPSPCRLSFVGIDRAKCELFESLGFAATPREVTYFAPRADDSVPPQPDVTALEYVKELA